MRYVLVDEVGSNGGSLLFWDDPLLEPSDGFPALELDHDLIGVDVLIEVEEDTAVYCVSCDVEGFVDLDEHVGHNR